MKMTGVQAEQLVVLDGIAKVKLVRADHIAFRANAEQLALDSIEIVLRIDRFGKDSIKRFGQASPWALAIDRRVLGTVRDPHVGDARRPERLPDGGADTPADDAVLDPEAANACVT